MELSHFILDKNAIEVTFSDKIFQDSEFLTFKIKDVSARFNDLCWAFNQKTYPHFSGSGDADVFIQGVGLELGFKLVRVPKGVTNILYSTILTLQQKTEKLCTLIPSFRVYLFTVKEKLLRGAEKNITLQTLLLSALSSPVTSTRNSSSTSGKSEKMEMLEMVNEEFWEPLFVLSRRSVTIRSLDMTAGSASLGWLYSLLANILSSVIKDSVATQLAQELYGGCSQLLKPINTLVGTHWETVAGYVKTPLAALPIVSPTALLSCYYRDFEILETQDSSSLCRDHVLVLEGSGSLGLKVDIQKAAVATGATGSLDKLFVLGAVPLSPAEKAIAELNMDELVVERARIRSINGRNIGNLPADVSLSELRTGKRPAFVSIRLSDEGSARLSKIRAEQLLTIYGSTFIDGSLGLKLKESKGCGGCVMVAGYARGSDGEILQAEMNNSKAVKPGMLLCGVGDAVLFGRSFDDAITAVSNAVRPVNFYFCPAPDKLIVFANFPINFGSCLKKVNNTLEFIITFIPSDQENLTNEIKEHMTIKAGCVLLTVNGNRINENDDIEAILTMLKTTTPSKIVIRNNIFYNSLIALRTSQKPLRLDANVTIKYFY